ncbi:MAG TPA: CHAT domain-containing protein [Blastocatellia bacterium]|nr:CHAT domain-containing protein [Blastocatellia bacterium]
MAQDEKDIRPLEPGTVVEREIAGQQIHSYRITLAAGLYLGLVVHKHGANAVVRVIGPDGKEIAEMDASNNTSGPVPVSLVAEASGIYMVEIGYPVEAAPAGRYELRIGVLREATDQDRRLFAAQNKYNEAVVAKRNKESWGRTLPEYEKAVGLFRNAGAHQWEAYALAEMGDFSFYKLRAAQKAIDYYSRALNLSSDVNDPSWQAYTLNNMGQVYRSQGDKQRELEYYTKALPLWRASGDLVGQAITLYNIASAHNEQGRKSDAIEFFSRSLDIRRALSDRDGIATVLSAIGAIHNSLGERQQALERFKEAVPLFHSVGDHQGEASSLTFIGMIYSGLGENRNALDFLNQALVVRRAGNDKRGEGITLAHIGKAYSDLGESQQALGHYIQALRLFQAVEDSQFQANALNSIAVLYSSLGDDQKAIAYFNDALEFARKAKTTLIEARILNSTGRAYLSLGDKQKALRFFSDALRLFQFLEDRMGKASALNNLGRVYFDLKDNGKATDLYRQAIEAIRGTGNPRGEATVLTNIGAVYDSAGDKQTAIDFYTQAIVLNRSAGYQSGEANTLYHLARAERDRGDLIEARTRIEASLGIIETLRTKVASEELRASYFASVQERYEFYIDLLMRMQKQRPTGGFDVAALHASERARARSLLELLTEARADIRQGVDPTVLERERRLRELLNAKAERQMQLLSVKHTEEQAGAIARELSALATEYQALGARIREESPHYAALTQPQPLTVGEIQQQVLDPGTLLLEYALGDERSYLWAVTQSTISSFELPKRAEVESAARRVYELLTARNRIVKNEIVQKRRARLAQAEAEYAEAAVALSQIVLSPVSSLLGRKRLVIVSEGALQYVPFAALPVPRGADGSPAMGEYASERLRGPAPTAGYKPLAVEHEIVSLPSASVLAVLRRETAGRKPAPRPVAVLADPVFDKDDERVRRARGAGAALAGPSEQVADVDRAVRDVGLARDGGRTARLPFSGREAKAIFALVPPGEGMMALDFKASRATATSAELSQYRIVHFATHGLLNSEHPELSGIVLSLVDENGAPQDGFLRLHDIYNLKLPADLVVLSACQTALGKDIKGEGLIGLTRGFMYAGAARVAASLWKVDDKATAELMKRFYRGMIRDGLRPAAALQSAQAEMWKQKRWKSPYYWAAFVLQGEWK